MLKSLITALALVSVAVMGFAALAQAHHKVGHCFPPGALVAGCPLTPQAPTVPKPQGK
jgi:hypothetical protein